MVNTGRLYGAFEFLEELHSVDWIGCGFDEFELVHSGPSIVSLAHQHNRLEQLLFLGTWHRRLTGRGVLFEHLLDVVVGIEPQFF